MNIRELSPLKLITTRDFPVHNAKVLDEYFALYRSGKGHELPPVPLVHRNHIMGHFVDADFKLFLEYIKQNPEAEYFLLNGSHRTTAASLTRSLIKCAILETDDDITECRQITFNGKPYEHLLEDTLQENIQGVTNHFRGTRIFETVQQKTDRMVIARVLSDKLIKFGRYPDLAV